MFALGLFAASAERNGFVVISSYNSLSDGPIAPNVGAVNAMLSEAQEHLSVDMNRLYIAGLSGTASLGWQFALEAPANFAGLISASAPNSFDDSTTVARLKRHDFALPVMELRRPSRAVENAVSIRDDFAIERRSMRIIQTGRCTDAQVAARKR
jgi:pimeloyl-ACP methyl ester carboxylesterase